MTICRGFAQGTLLMLVCITTSVWGAPVSSAFTPQTTRSTSTSTFKPITEVTSGTTRSMPAYEAFTLAEGIMQPMTLVAGTTHEGRDSGYLGDNDCSAASWDQANNVYHAAFCKVWLYYPPYNSASELKKVPEYLKTYCPSGFTPKLEVTPVNSNTSQGRAFACTLLEPEEKNEGGRGQQYRSRIKVSAVSYPGTTIKPSTGVAWKIKCYPSKDAERIPPTPTDCQKEPGNFPRQILLWDMGFINYPSGYNTSGAQTVTTNRACPSGYSPYFTINNSYHSPGFGSNANRAVLVGGEKICVNQTTPYTVSGGAYKLNYFTNLDWTVINHTETTLTVNSTNTNSPWKDSRSGLTYSITWQTYCYPPGMDIPAYFESCNDTNHPQR